MAVRRLAARIASWLHDSFSRLDRSAMLTQFPIIIAEIKHLDATAAAYRGIGDRCKIIGLQVAFG
jgi:hypothetical protein